MIPLLDDYFKSMLEAELNSVQSHPQQLDDIFGASKKPVAKLKEYLGRTQKSPVKVVLAYPTDPQVIPCIVVQLGGEQDMPEGLGDTPDDQDLVENTLEHSETLEVQLDQNNKPYIQTSKVAIREVNPEVFNQLNESLSRPDQGKLYFSKGFVKPGDLVNITYSYVDSIEAPEIIVRTRCTYRFEIWDNNVDRAVMLYAVLKSFLLRNRLAMTEEGLCNITLSGADFEPLPEYFPVPLFRRALSAEFTIINAVKSHGEIIQSANAIGEVMESGEDVWN